MDNSKINSKKDKGDKSNRHNNHQVLAKLNDPNEYLINLLGDSYKKYRDKWNETLKGSVTTDYPLHLNFELTYGCNLKCEMCIYSLPISERGYRIEKNRRISLENFSEIIDEGSEMGLCSVSLNSYNEPLLCKNIDEYVKYAKKKNIIDIFFSSNAILLEEEMIIKLLESGLTKILFSIDAFTSETYEKIRKADKLKKVVSNILRFVGKKNELNKKLPITRVSFVENAINTHEKDDFIKFWEDKIDYILVQQFTNPFAGKNNYNEINNKFNLDELNPLNECRQLYQRLVIANNGDVHPCCSNYGYSLILGNIYKESIGEIWNKNKTKELREQINSDSKKQPKSCILCRNASRGA